MGGEKVGTSLHQIWLRGSPPRGRGKDFMFCGQHLVIRITPAWTGKRSQVAAALQSGWDHPRVGGEKFVDESHFYKNLGSPPHGRGNADPKRHRTRQAGITPAWAGKRRSESCRTTGRRDHPRMGGEKRAEKVFKRSGAGSPPRRRGKALGQLL